MVFVLFPFPRGVSQHWHSSNVYLFISFTQLSRPSFAPYLAVQQMAGLSMDTNRGRVC